MKTKGEVNTNTGELVSDLIVYTPIMVQRGKKTRNALRAAYKAVIPGGQTHKQIEQALDKMQYAFNRSLKRSIT